MSSLLFDQLGPRGRRRAAVATWVTVALGLAALAFLGVRLQAQGQLEADRWLLIIDPNAGVLRTLGTALLATLQAAFVAMLGALLIGGVLAALRLSRRKLLRTVATMLVELFRGIPLLLLMLFSALALPQLGIELSVFAIVVLALVVYNSAVICEIIRAGINAIPAGQQEAAAAMGMRPLGILLRIQLPQAIPAMMPLLVSQLVILLKDTSIGYVVGYAELLRGGRSLVEFYGNRYSLQIYLTVAVIYILTNVLISLAARWLTKRNTRKRRPRPALPGSITGSVNPPLGTSTQVIPVGGQ